MAQALIIVESPTKAKTIRKLLGSGYRVEASVGHIRDLPIRELGVDLETFEPQYVEIEGKGKLIGGLRKAVKEIRSEGGTVFLATDPDREGEAIAWHLQEVLKLGRAQRIHYSEITESAVKAALRDPHPIDLDRVRAQEARRVLDRLWGYKVTDALRRKTRQKLTAGRVQTVAVMLIVDREHAIRNFVATDHYGVSLFFDGENPDKTWKGEWNFKPLLAEGQKLWTDRDFAQRIAQLRDVRVLACDERQKPRWPAPPFKTVTLQQAASNALRFNVQKTMQLAQSLFQKGYITYHRTDLENLSDEAIGAIRDYAKKKDLPLPAHARKFKAKAGVLAQEAHEAIRPANVWVEDVRRGGGSEPGSDDEQKLYTLIRNRAIASQLAEAIYDVRTVTLEAIEPVDGTRMQFVATGRTLRFPGFLRLTPEDPATERKDEPEARNPVPALTAGTQLRARDGKVDEKKTEPPARYTEATLTGALESEGIGRPSTYAAIITKIQDHGYVTLESDRRFRPTKTGETLIAISRGRFSIVDLGFTRAMEEELDLIADGKAGMRNVSAKSYAALEQNLRAFQEVELALSADAFSAPDSGVACPQCKQGTLVKRFRRKDSANKKGGNTFWSCSRYPECKAAFNDSRGKPALGGRGGRSGRSGGSRAPAGRARTTPASTDGPTCPKCSKGAIVQRSGKFGTFFGCTNYSGGCKATFKSLDAVAQ